MAPSRRAGSGVALGAAVCMCRSSHSAMPAGCSRQSDSTSRPAGPRAGRAWRARRAGPSSGRAGRPRTARPRRSCRRDRRRRPTRRRRAGGGDGAPARRAGHAHRPERADERRQRVAIAVAGRLGELSQRARAARHRPRAAEPCGPSRRDASHKVSKLSARTVNETSSAGSPPGRRLKHPGELARVGEADQLGPPCPSSSATPAAAAARAASPSTATRSNGAHMATATCPPCRVTRTSCRRRARGRECG